MLYTHKTVTARPVRYVKEMRQDEAFAQLAGNELGPYVKFFRIEARILEFETWSSSGYEICTYESDDPRELLPLIAAAGYSAAINHNNDALQQCDTLLADSGFVIDLGRIEDAWQFNKNAAIALAVAGISPDERMTNWQQGEWKLALVIATLFSDPPAGYREQLIKELVSA